MLESLRSCHYATRSYRTVSQVAKSFTGGSEAFLSVTNSSYIRDASSLESHLRFDPHCAIYEHVRTEIQEALETQDITPSSLFIRFINGKGVPNPEAWAPIKHTFDSVIDLSKIDSPNFRARMFAWASSGVPFLDTNLQAIDVGAGFSEF